VPKLKNAKHEKFCQEYVKNPNGNQAYLAAYPGSEKSSRVNASNLLAKPNIMQRISELQDKCAKRNNITQDAVVKRLADIAFGHLGMVCSWGENGLEVKESSGLTEQELSTLDFIDISPVSDGDGGLLGYRKKIKMRDALKALEMLSKYLGLFDGKGPESRDREAIKARLLELVASRVR